jgi:hypothetical protein
MKQSDIKITEQMKEDIKSSMATLRLMRSMTGNNIHPELMEELEKSEHKMASMLNKKKKQEKKAPLGKDNTVNKKYLYIAAGIAIGLVAVLILVDNLWL